MKFTDKLVTKFGVDKMLHFLVGAWITANFSIYGWYGLILGFIITIILSLIKEIVDTIFDINDIVAATLGSWVSILIYIFLYFLKLC